MTALPINKHALSRGVAAVEFALIVTLLVSLAFPVMNYARAIQANTILINITREGANLASRGPELDQVTSQAIMNALAATAPPLNMQQRGMIYITQVSGRKEGGVIRNVVLHQYRWANGINHTSRSAIWNCPNWGLDGSCNPDDAPTANLMTGKLGDGEIIFAVEGFYQFEPLLNAGDLSISILPTNLSAITIF